MTRIPQIDYETPRPNPQASGLAITSMVLGIISLPTVFCFIYLSPPCAITGLVLGIVARGKVKRGQAGGAGMAKAGIICSIVALALDAAMIVVFVLIFIGFNKRMPPVSPPSLTAPPAMTTAPAGPAQPAASAP